MSPGELAEHEKVQPPSMTRVIAALEAGGLVTRMPHPTDRGRCADGDLGRPGRGDPGTPPQGSVAGPRLKELSPQERATLRAAAPILEKLSQS